MGTTDTNGIAHKAGTDLGRRFSQALSYILHPLMIPTLVIVILLYGNTVMTVIPNTAKLVFLGIVAINTLVIPALFLGLLHTLKYLPDLNLDKPRDRIVPMIIVSVCYLVCSYMLSKIMLAYLIKRFLFAALFCLLFNFIVNFFWKISLHMTAMGGLVAMLVVFNFSGFATLPYTLMAFILLAGALGSARMYLGHHNLAQVAAGFAGGFLITGTVFLFF